MKYLLDTNICIRYINGRAPKIREQILKVNDSEIAISTITMGEMYAGAAKSQYAERSRAKQDAFFIRFQHLDFDELAADRFGSLCATLEKAGTPMVIYTCKNWRKLDSFSYLFIFDFQMIG